jgi:hypothetical protein
MPRVLEEDSLLCEAYRLDVAVSIEDRKRVVMEQGQDARM